MVASSVPSLSALSRTSWVWILPLVLVPPVHRAETHDFVSSPALVAAQGTAGLPGFPTRAFLVEGGAIALQAGVMRDPQVQPMPIGKFKYPTVYFVTVSNETRAPVWVDLEWQFPGDKPHQTKGKRLDLGGSFMFSRSTFGVIDGEPINLRFLVYTDDGRSNKIGSEETFMQFEKADKEAFIKNFSKSHGLALISGWPEMGAVADSVPGTIADAKLQRDVQLLLWKEESKYHRDCKHEVRGAEPASLDSSATLAAMLMVDSAEAARLLARTQDTTPAGRVQFEHWRVKSCDFQTTYEVLLQGSPSGGTDFAVRKVPEAGSNQ
jgi:hypothetical protein